MDQLFLDAVAEQLQQRLTAQLFGQHTEPADIGQSFSWEAFERSIERLKQKGPTLNTIWFIDSQQEYHQFLEMFPEVQSGESGQITGIKIIEWYMRFFDPSKEAIAFPGPDMKDMIFPDQAGMEVWPWICQYPGVWLSMSDGTYRRIEFKTKEA